MKRFWSVFGVGLALTLTMWATPQAEAGPIVNEFFSGVINQASDNSAQYLVNVVTPGGAPASQIDVGDILVGMFQINTIENQSTGATNNFLSGTWDRELTGIFIHEVVSKVGGGPGITPTSVTLAPLTAAGSAALLAASPGAHAIFSTWAPGTIVAAYEDPANDYSRLFDGTTLGPDDGAPDAGVGPFVSEEALLARAFGPTALFEFGFLGLAGEGWSVFANDDDIALLGAAPLGSNVGIVNFALNLTANFTSLQFGPIASSFGGFVQLNGSGNALGIGGSSTPFDNFDNVDLVFNPSVIPEPSSLVIWGLVAGVLGVGGVWRRKKVKRAA